MLHTSLGISLDGHHGKTAKAPAQGHARAPRTVCASLSRLLLPSAALLTLFCAVSTPTPQTTVGVDLASSLAQLFAWSPECAFAWRTPVQHLNRRLLSPSPAGRASSPRSPVRTRAPAARRSNCTSASSSSPDVPFLSGRCAASPLRLTGGSQSYVIHAHHTSPARDLRTATQIA